jgi:hypothetical protein
LSAAKYTWVALLAMVGIFLARRVLEPGTVGASVLWVVTAIVVVFVAVSTRRFGPFCSRCDARVSPFARKCKACGVELTGDAGTYR